MEETRESKLSKLKKEKEELQAKDNVLGLELKFYERENEVQIK